MTSTNEVIDGLQRSVDKWKSWYYESCIAEGIEHRHALRKDHYFFMDLLDLQAAKRYRRIEFIDVDQVFWTTVDGDDLDFYNAGVADRIGDRFYSPKSA